MFKGLTEPLKGLNEAIKGFNKTLKAFSRPLKTACLNKFLRALCVARQTFEVGFACFAVLLAWLSGQAERGTSHDQSAWQAGRASQTRGIKHFVAGRARQTREGHQSGPEGGASQG